MRNLVFLLILLLLSACAATKPAIGAFSSAETALEAAVQAGADEHSPVELPADERGRARVRSIAQSITSEIQPLNNLGVMQYLKKEMEQTDEAVRKWYVYWVDRGFSAIETWLESPHTGRFCHGDAPGLADCFLVPQVYNAERFNCDLEPYPKIMRITSLCRQRPGFRAAAPENQPDKPVN